MQVKLPVTDLSLGFSGDLLSVGEIKIVPGNDTGLWIYSLLSDPLRQLQTLRQAWHPAAQVVTGVERFTQGKNEIGGSGFFLEKLFPED